MYRKMKFSTRRTQQEDSNDDSVAQKLAMICSHREYYVSVVKRWMDDNSLWFVFYHVNKKPQTISFDKLAGKS